MEDLKDIQSFIVGGYEFETREDYIEALKEKKAIHFIDSKLDLDNDVKLLSVYTEIIEKRLFKTPLGMEYLKKMKKILQNSSEVDKNEILPIYVPSFQIEQVGNVDSFVTNQCEVELGQMRKKIKSIKTHYRTSLLLNMILLIMVIVMFLVTLSSSSTTIINYEHKLQDKYASWAEELKQKEKELESIEEELNNQQESTINSQN